MERSVVITGIGAITPVGAGKEGYWRGLASGTSGVTPITTFDVSEYSTRIAGEVKDFEPLDFIEKKEARRMDRFCQFAVAASRMALEDAGLPTSDLGPDCGVLIATGIGGLSTLEAQHKVLLEKGPRRINPLTIPMIIPNMASAQVEIAFGARGPCTTVVTACASSANGIGDAFEIVKRGAADVMIAGGSDACITPVSVASFGAMGALSKRNNEPEAASRPFDRERDGFVIGEAAGVVILEERRGAEARGARIYAEVAGYGMAGEAMSMTGLAPDGDGFVRAMVAAMDQAGISPDAVDYINAHGTATPLNDPIETLAVKRVFGDRAARVAMSSTKSMTGHCLGAAGAIEIIACLMAIENGVIPPTINYEFPDPDCDLDYVPNRAREATVNIALSNSQGFGGHSASLVVRQINKNATLGPDPGVAFL
ncbi:MAG: beta-ketoacyl-[acyl-carrier-protein] synthase II [Candidatus Anoxymicrobium japonicum]|uniref:3-oxoacyl-[acyl-carrier-protein] synthase 2 n=1 Tax=Candidatus Anoxymicrobium japonicum TaxID=2013648 RepID=A0A2N3G584_9ACTN|nr:MAG: beta-ketoacyl-[acyl-carrier-protein] synthase II [Candidatus Anoxymicrobium japonicum]